MARSEDIVKNNCFDCGLEYIQYNFHYGELHNYEQCSIIEIGSVYMPDKST